VTTVGTNPTGTEAASLVNAPQLVEQCRVPIKPSLPMLMALVNGITAGPRRVIKPGLLLQVDGKYVWYRGPQLRS
jgi:hypothetical protein